VKYELGLDPACFFHKADYVGIIDGSWNSATCQFKNIQTLNQEQYLHDLDDCFMINKEFLPEVVLLEQTKVDQETANKAMAMANGEDDVSVLSQLTDKTLKASMSRTGSRSPSDSTVSSQQSGMTSKSKTQAAVKEALRDVSIQHNQAMQEQQAKFQKEIESLRQALASRTTVSPNTQADNEEPPKPEEVVAQEHVTVEDSSDDELSLNKTKNKTPNSPTGKSVKSPARKRAKRSRGGRSSSSNMLNE